jgi:hypothetical protein
VPPDGETLIYAVGVAAPQETGRDFSLPRIVHLAFTAWITVSQLYGAVGSASTIVVAARGCSPEGLARGDRVLDDNVKFKEDNVKFKAIAVIATATALSLGMAGSAAASPLSPKPKPAPQATGVRLQSALLPTSAFGDGFTVTDRLNTGKKLWSTRARIKPSSLSCVNFEAYVFAGGFGNTAGAADSVGNPNPAFADYPSVILGGDQAVLQFRTAQAAASFYSQASAKYQQCSYFTESDPADKSIQFELSTQSLSKTTIGRNKAFQVTQIVDLSAVPAFSFFANTAVVLAGTNVYTVDDVNGTNDPISASLLGNLIKRVQALYKHH